MKIFIIFCLLLVFSTNLKSEIIKHKEKYRFNEDVSVKKGCEMAEQRAKEEAIKKVSGQIVSSETRTVCSEVDGKAECEQNSFSINTLNGEIISSKILSKNNGYEAILNTNQKIAFCEIEIEAEILPILVNKDPNFNFVIKQNKINFRNGEDINLQIEPSKNMYLYIFQWHPYEKKNYQVYKMFPNEHETNNLILANKVTSIPSSDKISYKVEFPKNQNRLKIDEHLYIVGSEKKLAFLNKYFHLADLKKQMRKLKKVNVKIENKHYTILR